MADRKRALSSAVLGTKESEKVKFDCCMCYVTLLCPESMLTTNSNPEQEKYEDLSICQILQQAVKAYELSSDIYPAAAVASESLLPIPA